MRHKQKETSNLVAKFGGSYSAAVFVLKRNLLSEAVH